MFGITLHNASNDSEKGGATLLSPVCFYIARTFFRQISGHAESVCLC